MFFVLFPQESLFRDAGHSVHSSVLTVEMNCPLQIIKELSTLDNNFAAEAVLEQLKLDHKVVYVVDGENRKICVTLLRYNVDKPESSYAQVRLIARNKEDEKVQQVVYVNFTLEETIYLLDVMNSVYDKVIINQPICNVS